MPGTATLRWNSSTRTRRAPYPVTPRRRAPVGYSFWRCVMTWVLLFVAGLFETVWALALKESDGFSKLGPTALFAVTMVLSMVLLALALRSLPVGTGYAVWTGTGAVGAAIAGMILLGEAATLNRILPIGLVAVGIVWLAVAETA